MGDPVPDSKTPVFVALAMAAAGLVIAILFHSGGMKLFGALIAACGAIPSAVGMWKGIQQEKQGTLASSLGTLFLALGMAVVLIVWAIIVFVHG
jgi:hypothetical protein